MSDTVRPIPGDIWSARAADRRVKVLNVWSTGRVQVKGVMPAGANWAFVRGACSRSIDGASFPKRFRLLTRGAP